LPTDPLTGSRYPASSDSPNVAQYIQNAVMDLSDNTIPRFATTTARDSAYAAYVTAGGVMADGMVCWCDSPGNFYDRIGGAWVVRPRVAFGRKTITTNGTGDFTVTHGLGVTPTVVFIMDHSIYGFGGHTYGISATTNTTFTARAYYQDAPDTSSTIDISWEVKS
jgi:hypothetical protein